jgi:hypothetical protein
MQVSFTSQTVVVVPHSFPTTPYVTVVNSVGRQVRPGIVHAPGQVTVTFGRPTSGIITLIGPGSGGGSGPASSTVGQPINVIRYIGDQNIPRDIKQHRGNNLDAMRRFGAPVIIKHMYISTDVDEGVAIPSPNFDDVYGQTRKGDPISHGIGFVSAETSPDEWVSPEGLLVTSPTSPGAGYTPAPKYRGYGPGYLTYVIMPDVATDVFKLNEVGALIKIQTAMAQMGWFPEVNDNDLIISVTIDQSERVIDTHERYLAKMTNPVSMRGLDRKGRRERSEDFGNRHVVDQNFEMTLLPAKDTLYSVETDR